MYFIKRFPDLLATSRHCAIIQNNNLSHSIKNVLSHKYYLQIGSRNSSTHTCWNCGNSVTDNLFCEKCHTIQRLNTYSNYFRLLNIDYGYNIELSDLSMKYKKLQTVLHPDKFSTKTKEEQSISEELSSLVNKAYSTLSNPIERGLYMLKLNGETIEEGTVQLDAEFLMNIMELNEELEGERDPAKLKEMNRKNKNSMELLIKDLTVSFQKNDISTAKEALTKLKYYGSIDSKIKDMKQKLDLAD